MAKSTTIFDIAKETGLSPTTVSQALRPRAGSTINLPDRTIERVKEVAEKLNYRPHAGARSIRATRFDNIGFFVAAKGLFVHSPDDYLAGVHDAASEAGYRVTNIRLSNRFREIADNIPKAFNERSIDSLIISSYHPISRVIHEKLNEQNLPVVYLNDKNATNSIYVNDIGGALKLTQYLISKGKKRIAFILRKTIDNPAINEMHHSAKDRIEGYSKAMESAGLTPKVITILATEIAGVDHDFPDDAIDWPEKYDALFAYDDDLANQIGRFCYQHKIRIPDDISLVGFNGDYGSACAWQNLTTMRIPAYNMGTAAFKLCHQLIEKKPNASLPAIVFEPELVIGKTV